MSYFNKFSKENTYKYFEKDIIVDERLFFENILSKSFFEEEKLILVFEITDKILNIIKEAISRNITDTKIILIAKKLDKKSKIRSFFEKEKNTLTTPFYRDTLQTLLILTKKKLDENKIFLSQEQLNFIIERSQGDRISLNNELEKIINFSKNKKINFDDIIRLTNLGENYSASELIDNLLSKNKKKTLNILNENISSSDENILIIKTYLYKLKRLKQLKLDFDNNNDLEKTVNSFKPPIFWKDKIVLKEQIKMWNLIDIQELIKNVNETEFLIKKNPQISNQLLNNMILDQINTRT
tara:strand:- start:804 stop:1694 length:891 start_codon:yes stop_codon:yes gene_type:complete